jgi:sodium-coupled neutral amino acid transporter 11
VLCAAFGAGGGYTFALIGRLCSEAGVEDFKALAVKYYGTSVARVLSVVVVSNTFLACLSYSIVIADTFTAILGSVGLAVTRNATLLGASAGVLLPLCLLKDLSALAFTSVIGTGGMVYTMLFMILRLLDKSYGAGGRFAVSMVASQPVDLWSVNLKTLVLVSVLATAYVAHFSAPKFYADFKDATVPKFNKVVYLAFAIVVVLTVLIVVPGYVTFGSASAGFILNNYSNADPLAFAARVAVGVSVVGTYPLVFAALRDGLRTLVGAAPEAAHTRITTVAFSIITLLALVIKDVGFVAAVAGALFGTLLMFTFPGLFFLRSGAKKGERTVARGLVGSGVLFGILGVVVSVIQQFFPRLL